MRSIFASVFLSTSWLLAGAGAASAQTPERLPRTADNGRLTVIEENDAFTPDMTDRHYTQGFQASYLSPALEPRAGWNTLFPEIGGLLFDSRALNSRRVEINAGQAIFTPRRLQQIPPNPFDRPFAGWLYGGLGLLQETNGRMLERVGFEYGVVGPASQAEEVQSGFHGLIGSARVNGWRYQLHNEPGLVLSYERKWRFDHPLTDTLSFNVIPEIGASVGNVYTYGQVGALVRFGQNLEADYGPARMRPSFSGSNWFDASRMNGPYGWYVFASAQARGVAQNIFLDGNTWVDSASVSKNAFVGDVSGGISVFSTYAKLDFQLTARSKEFKGQQDFDRYGGIALTVALP